MAKFANRYIQPIENDFIIDMIFQDDTLNIFSDASLRSRSKLQNIMDSCYGSVAVCKDTIIDEEFRLNSETTVPAAEIRGLRWSLCLALRYRYKYRIINIFSDSQIAVFGLRDYIYNWMYNPQDNCYYNHDFKKTSKVKNQELYIECFQLLNELRKTNIVNIFHQSGHVENGYSELRNGIIVFKRSNGILGKMDYASIRYISLYNNYVDQKSRSILRRTNIYEQIYSDPVKFYPNTNLNIQRQDQNTISQEGQYYG